MPVEAANYIWQLEQDYPIGTESKSEGDDHIRTIKKALKQTFPTITKVFRPSGMVYPGNPLIQPEYANQAVGYDCTAADIVVTLPSGLGFADVGTWVELFKADTTRNGLMVVPAGGGSIFSRVGASSSIRIEMIMETVKFIWSGGGWWAFKTGPMIGQTINFDGVTIPQGYLATDGTVFNGAKYAELALVLGGTTLPDKMGRVEVGVDTVGRLAGIVTPAKGSVGGAKDHGLTRAELPLIKSDVPGGSYSAETTISTYPSGFERADGSFSNTGLFYAPYSNDGAVTLDKVRVSGSVAASEATSQGTAAGATGAAHPIVQPTIVTNKLIRAC